MDRRSFLQKGLALGAAASLDSPTLSAAPEAAAGADREYWIASLRRIADPVLQSLAEGKLRARMPVETGPNGDTADRRQFTYLEAFGRLMCGIAPWLELGAAEGAEGHLRSHYAVLSRTALRMAVDPASSDRMNFNHGEQPVVDAAFLALAILRAPNVLWKQVDEQTRGHLVAALESSRVIQPGYNNWILFSGLVEAALAMMGARWDRMRVDYAVRTMNSWYKGDGVYGDGPTYHWDYYNSFVIHPMLLQVLDTVGAVSTAWEHLREGMVNRAVRYAAIQERMISPEASFPVVGRSLCYRFGAFHLLADIALRKRLPQPVSPQQVRSALTAVMRRMLEAPGTFDSNGWLTIGFSGHQPSLAEPYISTGSSYLCAAAFLPLGLPADDVFWQAPPAPWTSKKAWSGVSIPTDHAYGEAER